MNAIEVTGLGKDFAAGPAGARVRALVDVTLQVREGEVVGLLGPNGSGKSTLLKLLLGLLRPTAGCCRLWGTDPREPGARAAVGYLPEAPGFPPELTGFEVVRLHARLGGISGPGLDERVGRTLADAGLAAAMHRRVGGYSQGMRRRLGIAQALVHEPRLLILDEPAAGLDPAGAEAVRALLRESRARRRTVLVSSHLPGEAAGDCDRAVLLHRGRLVREGTVDDWTRRGARSTLVVDALAPALVEELRTWLGARGATLRDAEPPGAAIERSYREAVAADPGGGDKEP